MALSLQTRIRAVAFATAMLIAFGIGTGITGDHDEARGAVEAGKIRPLVEILNIARDKLPGEVVGVNIEQENDRWFYEFRTVDAQGRLFEIYVDARSGDVARTEEK